MTPRSKSQSKRTRSRKGCHACKKSKIKCDEIKPTCTNCLKLSKQCDYTLKLTWGGRPYKNPKIEKLNPVANLSRLQLSSIDNPNGNIIVKQEDGNGSGNSKNAKNPVDLSLLPTNFSKPIVLIDESINSNESNKIKSISNSVPSTPDKSSLIPIPMPIPLSFSNSDSNILKTSSPSLSPSDNLQYLLKMANPINSNPKPSNFNQPTQIINDYESLEESYAPQIIYHKSRFPSELQSQPESESQSRSPIHFLNETVSSNIQNVSNVLGNLFNEDIIQTNPWSFLEEIDKSVLDNNNNNINNKFDGRIIDLNQKLFDHYGNNANTDDKSKDNNDIINSSAKVESIDEDIPGISENDSGSLTLKDFTYDLNKLECMIPNRKNNLRSIPLIHQNTNIKISGSKNLVPYGSPSNSSHSSNSEFTESIPRGLLPLPDILLNVPYYYDSFLFYINSTSSILTPADSTIYINNPFKMVLPKLAMTNDGLMSLIIVFGLTHKSSLLQKDSSEVVDSLLSRALSELLALLNNKETSTSDLTLTLVMFLSSFLVFNFKSDKWRVHMKGAKQIILLRGYNKPFNKLIQDFKTENPIQNDSINSEIKKSKLLYFLIRWFAYIDVFTNLSSHLEPNEDEILACLNKSSPISNTNDALSPFSESFSSPFSVDLPSETNLNSDSQIDYDIEETDNNNLIKEESHKNIDYMLGFNIKFLPLYAQICKLIKHINLLKQIHLRTDNSNQFNISSKIIESSIRIQNAFYKLQSIDFSNEGNGNNNNKTKSVNQIIATNHCFLLMGLIQLYRRVLLIPRTSKIIQEKCSTILKMINDYVDTKNPSSLGVILPIFVAGCDCTNEDSRGNFLEILQDFKTYGSVAADSAIEIMLNCWNTGKDWYDVMYEEKKNVVFL